MATVGVYSFEFKVAPRGYHVYKETWSKARDGEEVKVELEMSQSSKNIGPYACAIRAKEEYSKYRKQKDIFRERNLHTYITLSEQRVVMSMGQWYLENFVHHQYQLVD